MTFIILMLILFGLLFVFSGIENKSISGYATEWIGQAQ
jgi:hypothetical protein